MAEPVLITTESRAAQVAALPPYSPEAAIIRIFGNRSWTAIRCDVCDQLVNAVVQVGEESDFDSATVYICRACCQKVLAMFPEPRP